MSKKSISHRYSIEYIHPASTTSNASPSVPKKTGKSWLLISLFFSLLLIAGFLFKSGKFSSYLNTHTSSKLSNTTETNATEINTAETNNNGISNTAINNKNLKAPTIDITENEKNSNNNSHKEIPISTLKTEALKENAKEKIKVTAPKQALPEVSSVNSVNQEQKTTHISNENNQDTLLNENDALIKSLDKLTEQLVTERQKNTGLETRLKDNLNKSDNLAKLLLKATNKKKNDDKGYLTALDSLEEENKEPVNTIEVIKNNNLSNASGKDNSQTKTNVTKIEDKKTLAVEANEKTKENLNYTNAISLSTKSQIDAIILAMEGIKTTSKPIKAKSKKSTLQSQNNDLISQLSQQMKKTTGNSEKNNNDLISVGLKGKINQLITSRELTGSSYKSALKKESKTRSNAVRSIVVKKGETLWSISKRAYGDGKYYKKILKANPQLTRKRKLHLVIGQVIRVPK